MVTRSVPGVEMLDIIQLATDDVPGTTAFYAQVLGAAVVDAPSAHWARVRLATIDIGVHARPPAGTPPHGWEPGFRVTHIPRCRHRLGATGARLRQESHYI